MFNIPRRFAGIKRFEQILQVLSGHGLGFMLEKMRLKNRSLLSKKAVSRPVELRIIFEELGGSFIKLGQFLSLRPDLIPKDYCDELSKLQDAVPSFPYSEVEHIVRLELKKPLKQVFRSFDKVPLAAASIGQVHTAWLKDGKKVAVKVMRPGIKALFQTDLEILEYLARLMKHHFNPEVFDPEEIFEEFKQYTENELDYLKEAKNIKGFHTRFDDSKEIVIPDVFDQLTTSRILTMSFVEGVQLRRIIVEPGRYKRVDRQALARRLSESFMKQIFIDGYFHADPHPGNIVVVSKDKIGFLDFGIVGKLDEEMKDKLGALLIGLINKDTDEIVEVMISLNVVDNDVDVSGLKRGLAETLGDYYDVSLEKIDIIELFFRCLNLAKKYKIKVSRDYVLLGKALITLRGVCAELYPGFNIVQETRPFIKKLVDQKKRPGNILRKIASESERFREFIHGLPDQSRKVYRILNKADLALDNINSDISVLTREIRLEAWRLVMGIIVSSLIISASMTYSIEPSLSKVFVVIAGVIMLYLLFSIVRDGLKRKN
jgi:ubiquinone biosynthesis protein